MKRRRFGLFLTMVAALMSLAVLFNGCDWFDDDDGGGGGGNGATTAKYVVVANTYGKPEGNLSVYKIQSDGTLTFQDNVAVSSGEPSMILLHPNKKFVYVASHNGSIHAFSFDVDSGALAEIEGSPYEYGSVYINMAITPDGKFLYVTDTSNGETQLFGVDNTTGELTFVDYFYTNGAHGIAMHPTGKFLFVGGNWEYGDGELFAFEIDPGTGNLTPAPGSPIAPGDPIPNWVWLQTSPDGKYLFGAGGSVGGTWSIDNVTGELTELHIEDTSAWYIKTLVIPPTLPYLYTAGWDNNSIGAYKANEDGTVDEVAGSPFAAGMNPKALTVTGDSKYLYVANYGDNKYGESSVMAYSISGSTGQLTKIGTYDTPYAFPKNLVAIP